MHFTHSLTYHNYDFYYETDRNQFQSSNHRLILHFSHFQTTDELPIHPMSLTAMLTVFLVIMRT